MEGVVIGEWRLELKRKSVCGKGDFQRYGSVVENYLDFCGEWLVAVEAFGAFVGVREEKLLIGITCKV